jgi:hypothetical protein
MKLYPFEECAKDPGTVEEALTREDEKSLA